MREYLHALCLWCAPKNSNLHIVMNEYVFTVFTTIQISRTIIAGAFVYLEEMPSPESDLAIFSFGFEPRFSKCGSRVISRNAFFRVI